MPDHIVLEFDPEANRLAAGKELRHGVSAIVQVGEDLWAAHDETLSVERLSPIPGDGGRYGLHRSFHLGDLLPLPGGDREEGDIEGLSWAGGCLWLVGSHSRRRRKPKPGESIEKNQARLARVEAQPNRFLLARLPLAGGPAGLVPVRAADGAIAARLGGDGEGNELAAALRDDPHLGPFLKLPGKDNGLDIEGIAVAGERIFLGLRGPVLRGWAVILEVEAEDAGPRLLALKGIGPGGRRYRKHFLQLRGLGIRDLGADGDDLLILAGPSMDLHGPTGVFRWRDGMRPPGESFAFAQDLPRVAVLPHGEDEDHAEGLAVYRPPGGPRSLLVAYDAAARARLTGSSGVRMDLLPFPAG